MAHDRQTEASAGKNSQLPPGSAVDTAGLVEYAAGSVVSRTILDNVGGSVTLFAFDAAQGLSEHAVPFDAVVSVLDGRANLLIGGEEVVVETGQLAIMPANVPHAIKGGGRFKMMLAMLRK